MTLEEKDSFETKKINFDQAKQNLRKTQYEFQTKTKILETYKQTNTGSNCSPQLKTIDLESQPQIFTGHTMELQGAFGTCFANATKNIILSITRGRKNASFLDLAIQSKEDTSLINRGLDGGGICTTLEKIKTIGICPQNSALLETSKDAVNYTLIHDIREMRKLKSVLAIYPQPKPSYVTLSKFNPELVFPYNEKVWAAWFQNYPETRQSYYFYFDAFLMEEWKQRLGFITNILSLKSGVNNQTFCSEYLISLTPLLQKYLISPDKFRNVACNKISVSNPYLSALNATAKQVDDLPSLMFLHQLAEVLKRRTDLDLRELAEKAFALNAHDFILLTFAPSCIEDQNRISFEDEFYCEDNYIKNNRVRYDPMTLNQKVRERILLHLSQGYALGNMTYGHVNTIVGYRWNPTSRSCEFKIRESQIGDSLWEPEDKILKNMQGLVEVR
jgi:hypothetical protein